jgi:hypothetical protein
MPTYHNAKISQLPITITPTSADQLAIVNNGVTREITLSGLTTYLNAHLAFESLTGGTLSGGTLILTSNNGESIEITGFSETTGVTGGTYDNNSGAITFTNATGGTFQVIGLPKNAKHWLNNETKSLDSQETLVISGNYVLQNSNLYLNTSGNQISIGSINFNECAQIFIGGYLLLMDSNIVNNGEISVAGDVIFYGNSTITGTGIII